MLKVRYTEPAKRDLLEIARYVDARDGPQAAANLIKKIRARIRTLEKTASGFRERKELGRGRRALVIRPYLAIFQVTGNITYVLRILHGRRKITPDMLPN